MPSHHPKIAVDEQGTLMLNFGSYGTRVDVAAISGDGRRVLMVREVGVAHVWDSIIGERLATLRPSSPLAGTVGTSPFTGPFVVFIESAALSVDGRLALLGLNDRTAAIYCVDSGEQLATLMLAEAEEERRWGVIRCVRYSADGELALVGFPNRTVGVWSKDGSRLIRMLQPEAPGKLVNRPFVQDTLTTSIATSTEHGCLFAGAVDMTASVFDLKTGQTVLEAREHAEDILAVFDGPEGIGWATTGGAVWVSAADGTAEKRLETGEHWCEVVFDGARLLARAYDGAVSLWSLSGQHEFWVKPQRPDMNHSWGRKAATLVLCDEVAHYPEGGNCLHVRSGGSTALLKLSSHLVSAILSPKQDTVCVRGYADASELFDVKTGTGLHTLPCPGGSGCIAFSPDGGWLAIGELGHGGGSYPRSVYIFDVMTGQRLYSLSGHDWQIRQLAFSPDGGLLASLADDLVVWDVDGLARGHREPVLRVQLDRSVGAVAFAGDRLVAVDRGHVRVFSGNVSCASFEAPIDFEVSWTISDDQKHIAVAGTQEVHRFNIESGQCVQTVQAPIKRPGLLPPLKLARQHDIRGGALLWRTEYGVFLHQSDGPRGWIEPLDLSPGGYVAVPCEGGASVLQVAGEITRVIGKVPFEGKLRAGRVVGGEVLLINEAGRFFRSSVPAR